MLPSLPPANPPVYTSSACRRPPGSVCSGLPPDTAAPRNAEPTPGSNNRVGIKTWSPSINSTMKRRARRARLGGLALGRGLSVPEVPDLAQQRCPPTSGHQPFATDAQSFRVPPTDESATPTPMQIRHGFSPRRPRQRTNRLPAPTQLAHVMIGTGTLFTALRARERGIRPGSRQVPHCTRQPTGHVLAHASLDSTKRRVAEDD